MKKIGLFYGTETKKTAVAGEAIQKAFGKEVKVSVIPIEKALGKDFKSYDCLIIGASTWFDGELPTYWDELTPELSALKLNNKKVAIFGLGDQESFPDNFVDSIGILAEIFEACGATIIGLTSPKEYHFNRSRALRDNQLLGLALDFENEAERNEERIRNWVNELKKII